LKLLRSEYLIKNYTPVLYLFCRENGTREIREVRDFVPYFYVPDTETSVRDLRMKYSTETCESINGDVVRKAYTNLPSDVAEIREKFTKTWEADILFPTRYMVDEVDSLEYTEPKVMYLDIEVDNSGVFPKVDQAVEEIICIGLYNSLDRVYTSFVHKPSLSEGTASKTLDGNLHDIRYYRDEVSMLTEFVEFLRSEGPDVLCGWNLVRFDLTYLMNRLDRLGFDVNKLSPIGSSYIRNGKDVVIKGIALIDLYDAYRKVTFNYEESYKLDYIAKKVTGEGKVAVDNIKQLWKLELDNLIEYNIQDVRLVYLIDKKLGLLQFLDEIRRLCFCQLEDTLVQSKTADSYILRMFHNKKVFPTKTEHERVEFEGALVQSWAKGIYTNVASFDVRSLYPSTIVTFNLSEECFSDTGDIQVNNYRINSTPKGFLPVVIENLFKERNKYKKLMKEATDPDTRNMYNSRQLATKILLNALYGQTAFPHSRLYYPKIAETITYVGRQLITWSKDFLDELGYKVLYCDTDGIFFQIDDLSKTELIRTLLNDSYTNFCSQYNVKSHIFEMESKALYRKAFFGATKKRYACHVVQEDGKPADKLQVIGFEVRRSDSSQFSRHLQEAIFDMVLRHDKEKEEVCRYIGSEIDRIRTGKFTFEEIGIPKGINKELTEYGKESDSGKKAVPANVRGAIYSRDVLKCDLSNKPKMIYISKIGQDFPMEYEGKPVSAVVFDNNNQIPPGTQIDIEKTLEKLVKDKVDSIFEALGWSLQELDVHWKGKAPKKGTQLDIFSVLEVK